MDQEVVAALWGAFVGGGIAFFSTYALEKNKVCERYKSAGEVFKFLNEQRIKADGYAGLPKSQKREFTILMNLTNDMTKFMFENASSETLSSFLIYSRDLYILNDYIQTDSLGLVNDPRKRLDTCFANFLNSQSGCCD